LERLLFDGFDSHWSNVATASRFKQCTGISGVGLIALDVGAYIRSRKQLNLNADGVKSTSPVMSRAAGFHDDKRYAAIDKPALKLRAGKAVLLNDTPGGIGHSHLKNRFGQVDGHDSSIHDGLLLLTDPHAHANQYAYFGAKRRRESIPSIEELWSIIGELMDDFAPGECERYIRHAGYGQST
jgi:hypothetical protein